MSNSNPETKYQEIINEEKTFLKFPYLKIVKVHWQFTQKPKKIMYKNIKKSRTEKKYDTKPLFSRTHLILMLLGKLI